MCNAPKLFLLSTIALGVASAQIEPTAGEWETWVSSVQAHTLDAPPDVGQTAAELATVRAAMARQDGSPGDVTKIEQIQFWNSGSLAYRWVQLANRELSLRNLPAPFATRALALVSTAVYDATIASWANKSKYMRPHPGEADATLQPLAPAGGSSSYPSEHAAAAGAASAVLSYLFPDAAEYFASLAEEAGRSRIFAGVSYPSDVAAGLALGKATGNDVVIYARSDRSDVVDTRVFPPAPGQWSSANPVTPGAGAWKPWVHPTAGQLRPPAPTPSDAVAVAEVRDYSRTVATNRIAYVWQPSFTTPWLDTLERQLTQSGSNANGPRATRAYALLAVAQHDATLACWDAKYAYVAPRPSQVDVTVVTLFPNPAHPSFPSGHACASGAMAAVLEYLFPNQTRFFTEQSFADMAVEGGMSTFYSGIHFKRDVEGGIKLGRDIALAVTTRAAGDGADHQ